MGTNRLAGINPNKIEKINIIPGPFRLIHSSSLETKVAVTGNLFSVLIKNAHCQNQSWYAILNKT